MKASERLTKELKGRINTYHIYKNFIPWKKEEFGLVDRLIEERQAFLQKIRKDQRLKIKD